MRSKVAIGGTVAGVLTSVTSAPSMRDHVRLVEVLRLFSGGMGTGAGLVSFLVARARNPGRSRR